MKCIITLYITLFFYYSFFLFYFLFLSMLIINYYLIISFSWQQILILCENSLQNKKVVSEVSIFENSFAIWALWFKFAQKSVLETELKKSIIAVRISTLEYPLYWVLFKAQNFEFSELNLPKNGILGGI